MTPDRRTSIQNRRKRGQALVLFTFFLVMLILFMGLGIDLGFAYVTRAKLSRAVDAACLLGIKNLAQGQDTAESIATNAFYLNYGGSGRDVTRPVPVVSFTTVNNNVLVGVTASATINTFFIRILPTWKTLTIGSKAEATRTKLIISLVLDRSGSMVGDGGAGQLPGAVTNFVNQFDDAHDFVSMNSFSRWATTDVTIGHNFKAPITAAVQTMNFASYTAAEPGMVNGLAQNQSVPIASGDSAIKVIVFFTDGMANTFTYPFDCNGVTTDLNINYVRNLYDPSTGAQRSDCTVPALIASINDPSVSVNTSSCTAMHKEAEARAIVIADQARQQGTIVFCVGLGSTGGGECGGLVPVINPEFLLRMANDRDGASFDPSLPEGNAYLTYDATQLTGLFLQIASQIQLRLTQ